MSLLPAVAGGPEKSHASPVCTCGRVSLSHPLPQVIVTFGLWLFRPRGKIATVALGAVGVDPVAFDHPVKRASIDAEYLGGACAIPTGDLEDV